MTLSDSDYCPTPSRFEFDGYDSFVNIPREKELKKRKRGKKRKKTAPSAMKTKKAKMDLRSLETKRVHMAKVLERLSSRISECNRWIDEEKNATARDFMKSAVKEKTRELEAWQKSERNVKLDIKKELDKRLQKLEADKAINSARKRIVALEEQITELEKDMANLRTLKGTYEKARDLEQDSESVKGLTKIIQKKEKHIEKNEKQLEVQKASLLRLREELESKEETLQKKTKEIKDKISSLNLE